MKRTPSPEELLPLTPLSISLLLVLADGPLHGYGIIQALEVETDGRIVPGAGTLYAALQRMADDGLIVEAPAPEDAGDPRRRYYALTTFGRAVARAELQRMSRLIELADAKRLLPGLRLASTRSTR